MRGTFVWSDSQKEECGKETQTQAHHKPITKAAMKRGS